MLTHNGSEKKKNDGRFVKASRKETKEQRLLRALQSTSKKDATPLARYQEIMGTDRGLESLIKQGKCPLVIEQLGSYHVVFPASPNQSRRKNIQTITNTTPFADDDKHVYVTHTSTAALKGPRFICRYMTVTEEQAATIVRRISKALIDLGRTKEAADYLIGKEFARPF